MIPSGTNLLKVKDYNIAVVLNLIRKYEPISRREIADRTGLSFQTAANITQNLFDLGPVYTVQKRARRRRTPVLGKS